MDNIASKLGHNNPPDILEEAIAPYGDVITEAESWLDGQRVNNEAQMEAVDQILKEIKSAEKAVKAAEDSEAKPLYDQWKAVKAKFTPTLDDLTRIKKGLAALVSDFKKALAEQKAEDARQARMAAEKAQREAEEAFRTADVADIEARREAEAKLQAAKDAQKVAVAAGKQQVKGLRTVAKYHIDDHRAALHWIAVHDRDAMTAFIDEYVGRNHKTKKIDGVRSWTEKEAF